MNILQLVNHKLIIAKRTNFVNMRACVSECVSGFACSRVYVSVFVRVCERKRTKGKCVCVHFLHNSLLHTRFDV